VETHPHSGKERTELRIEVDFVKFDRPRSLILAGDFDLQSHVGVIALAMINPDLRGLLIRMNAL